MGVVVVGYEYVELVKDADDNDGGLKYPDEDVSVEDDDAGEEQGGAESGNALCCCFGRGCC